MQAELQRPLISTQVNQSAKTLIAEGYKNLGHKTAPRKQRVHV